MMNNTKDNSANNIKLLYKWSNQSQLYKSNARKPKTLLLVFKSKNRTFKRRIKWQSKSLDSYKLRIRDKTSSLKPG